MSRKDDKYIPAFSYGLLTHFYDFVMRWGMRELVFKRHLIEQARIWKGCRVLDLGCGTGTLTILIKRAHPEAEVMGVDGDPAILRIAKSKVAGAGLDITLDYGLAFELPYNEDSFDRVVSSLVFHHLTRGDKVRSLKEVYRVLRLGGELHVADFGKPHNAAMSMVSFVMGRLEENLDNVKGLLPEMFRRAGFDHVEQTASHATIFGTVALYKAMKP